MTAWFSMGPQAGLEVLNAIPTAEHTADVLLLKARLLDAAGEDTRSVELLEAGLQPTVANSQIACGAASLLVKHGRLENALSLLKDISQDSSGGDPHAAVNRAGILALLNRTEDAAKAIKAAEQQWPDFAPAYLMQAYILAGRGQTAEAKKKARIAASMGVPAAATRCVLEAGSACDLRKYLATSACESSQ